MTVLTAGDAEYADALNGLDAALEVLAGVDPSSLSGAQKMAALGRMELARRHLDAADGRLVDDLDRSGGYQVDGHRNTKSAIKHRCRVSGSEALRRVRTDWDQAKARLGRQPRLEELARTRAQRTWDAFVNMCRAAAATPADAQSPEPLVNIVMTQEAFEAELARLAGADADRDPADVDAHRCHTELGDDIPAAEALQAALVGHVRRVVVDAASNVINHGRKRRLFTGSSRHAVEIQAMLRGRTGLRCCWPGDDGHPHHLQADHRRAAARGGPTNTDNGDIYCGVHNRLKEHGFKPVRLPDGTWTITRPDDTPITPAV